MWSNIRLGRILPLENVISTRKRPPTAYNIPLIRLSKVPSCSIPTKRKISTKKPNTPASLTPKMSYFVIGVSGVTCGGKTTLTKLLKRSFPWSKIIYQDSYFYDDDYEGHVRVPALKNHVNYEILGAMDMDKMCKDVQRIMNAPPEFLNDPRDLKPNGVQSEEPLNLVAGSLEETPNFDSGMELLKTVEHIDFDTSKYKNIPILIIEGFLIFGSDFIYDKCNVRFFADLDQDTCKTRRTTRSYNPPDCPGYFEQIVWPEYLKHFNQFIAPRKGQGITVFKGDVPIQDIWKTSVEIVACRLQENSSNEQNTMK